MTAPGSDQPCASIDRTPDMVDSLLTGSNNLRWALYALWLSALCNFAAADELLFSFGGGPQPGSSQNNWSVSLDYNFYRFERSPRQHILIGTSYTYIKSDSAGDDDMYAVSIYPQVSFYPERGSWAYSKTPGWAEPFFYFRALGPSYISSNKLGDRQQAHNFAFQAQIGVGAVVKTRKDTEVIVALSWKHFSNANLYDDNDGIDLPLMLNIGIKF